MAVANIGGRFQFMRATKKEWEEWKGTLLDGEIAIESDTLKMKFGDGLNEYKDLKYMTIGEVAIGELTPAQRAALKGDKGDPFTFDDFTQLQLDELAITIIDITKEGDTNIVTFKGGKQIKVKDGLGYDPKINDKLLTHNYFEDKDKIYKLKPTIVGEEVKFGYEQVGQILNNDFSVFKYKGDKITLNLQSQSEGYLLLYGKPECKEKGYEYTPTEADKRARYSIKVNEHVNSYTIDFTKPYEPKNMQSLGIGMTYEGELVLASVTVPEDKVKVIREEGL